MLDVWSITEPRINVNAIDLLVMKTETNKNLLKAICKGYKSEQLHKQFHADFIRGKGEGQIILLHGPPGTGKTLTAGSFIDQEEDSTSDSPFNMKSLIESAESVAEYTKRPLLSITAADLGHDPAGLERNLLTFFRDANDWGAIVLLDEADIYLERRSTQDLRRNSIVSSQWTVEMLDGRADRHQYSYERWTISKVFCSSQPIEWARSMRLS
jgi:SpoVK/Ycf46/Vps4 family AAA+-type ATPase